MELRKSRVHNRDRGAKNPTQGKKSSLGIPLLTDKACSRIDIKYQTRSLVGQES